MQAKSPNKVSRTVSAIEKTYRGCVWLLINLFVFGFLCWGLYGAFVGFRVETNGEITEGSVAGLDHFDGGAYSAIIEFEADGQTYSFEDDTASNPPRYEIGETVTVRYDRTNPNLAQIDSTLPLWLFPLVSVFVLLIALVLVNIWGWRAWRRGEDLI
ncbi:MAG: DUF3592 domain-containing protein [Chloroflexota bacterium]